MIKFISIMTAILVTMLGCSHPSSSSYELSVNQNATLKFDQSPEQLVMAGRKIAVDSTKPVLVEAPGYISTLVVPVNVEAGEIRIQLREYST